MDIGYGEGFVWYSDDIPSEIVKVRTENDIIVSYTAKNTNTGFVINYLLSKDTFYNTYSKVNTSVQDKVYAEHLETAKSKSGVNVSLGDLWVTKDDNAMLCEVVSIINEDGTVWVDSYSEEDGQVDGDTIDGFVNSYELVEICGDYVGVSDNNYKEQELQDAYNEGYDSGKNQWQDSYGFEVPNSTIESLESAAYKKGLKDKEGISESVKLTEYKKGYDKAAEYYKSMYEWDNEEQFESGYLKGLAEGKGFNKDEQNLNYRLGLSTGKEIGWAECENKLHSEMAERELELKQQGFKDGYNQAVLEIEIGEQGEDFWNDTQTRAVCKTKRKHSHYFKDISNFGEMDTYLFCRIWGIKDDSGALHHAVKKLIDSGKRGAGKSKIKDITEARDTLNRYIEIEEMLGNVGGIDNEDS